MWAKGMLSESRLARAVCSVKEQKYHSIEAFIGVSLKNAQNNRVDFHD